MGDKYFEIFEKAMHETEGDGIAKFGAATSAMRDAMLKDAPVWMKFNMISWMIMGKPDESIKWDKVNEMLKSDCEYDFDAFDYIDSKEKFYNAAADSRVSSALELKSMNFPYKRIACKDCGETFHLNIGQVMFYCKKEYPLPKRCPNCLSIKKTDKPLPGYELKELDGKHVAVRKEEKIKGYTPGYTQPLNGFAEALQKAGLQVEN